MSVLTDKTYSLQKTGDILVFRTANFSSGRGSVLNSGIYSRELASALAALTLGGVAYAAAALNWKTGALPHAVFLVVFSGGFFLLRTFIFREGYLETVFDRSRGYIEIFFSGVTKKKRKNIPLRALKNILIERENTPVVNPDGARFVEKISSQHGMPIPGFDEEKVMFLLKLVTEDGADLLIYADTKMEAVVKAHEQITDFLEENILTTK